MAMAYTKCAKYYHLTNQIDLSGTNLCCDVLFKRENFPTDEKMLYHKLEEGIFKENFHKADLMRIFPYSKMTNVREWSLTLFMRVIDELFRGKYNRLLRDLKTLRDALYNKGNKDLSNDEFEKYYGRAKKIFKYHGFEFNVCNESGYDDTIPLKNWTGDNLKLTNQGSLNIFLLL